MTTKYFETKEQFIAFRNAWAKAAQAGKITAAHMVMYNAIRGKDLDHGFTPVTNHNKLNNGTRLNHGFVDAVNEYMRIADWSSRMVSEGWVNDFRQGWVNDFIAPFEGTLVVDDLQWIEVEKVETLWADYGQGLRLKKKILNGARPNTFAELFALDVEDAA